jgi:hypothetical protein
MGCVSRENIVQNACDSIGEARAAVLIKFRTESRILTTISPGAVHIRSYSLMLTEQINLRLVQGDNVVPLACALHREDLQ